MVSEERELQYNPSHQGGAEVRPTPGPIYAKKLMIGQPIRENLYGFLKSMETFEKTFDEKTSIFQFNR